MKITGYTSMMTVHDCGRPVGDVNGVAADGITEVPVPLLHTDGWLVRVDWAIIPTSNECFRPPRTKTPSRDRDLRPDVGACLQDRAWRRHVRNHRRDRHGDLGPQAEDVRGAAVEDARGPRSLRPR